MITLITVVIVHMGTSGLSHRAEIPNTTKSARPEIASRTALSPRRPFIPFAFNIEHGNYNVRCENGQREESRILTKVPFARISWTFEHRRRPLSTLSGPSGVGAGTAGQQPEGSHKRIERAAPTVKALADD